MSDFKIGETVRHKASGDYGPSMSINYIGGPTITCNYWHETDKVFKKAEFNVNELIRAEPPKMTIGF
jgi:hypothetical protein